MLAVQILIDGFAISALYGLGAVGFTLMFGVSGGARSCVPWLRGGTLIVGKRFHAVLRDGNRFTLLGDGREFFSHMLAAIDASRLYVLAEFYLVESGRVMDDFIAAFARATQRSVRVRAMFDAFGARGLSEADRSRLRAARLLPREARNGRKNNCNNASKAAQ